MKKNNDGLIDEENVKTKWKKLIYQYCNNIAITLCVPQWGIFQRVSSRNCNWKRYYIYKKFCINYRCMKVTIKILPCLRKIFSCSDNFLRTNMKDISKNSGYKVKFTAGINNILNENYWQQSSERRVLYRASWKLTSPSSRCTFWLAIW